MLQSLGGKFGDESSDAPKLLRSPVLVIHNDSRHSSQRAIRAPHFILAAIILRRYSNNMTASVAHLVQEALLLPGDERTELVEAILGRSAPTDDFIRTHLSVIAERMEDVRAGRSHSFPAVYAHNYVRTALSELITS